MQKPKKYMSSFLILTCSFNCQSRLHPKPEAEAQSCVTLYVVVIIIIIILTHKGFHFCFFLQKIEICFWLNLNQEKIN